MTKISNERGSIRSQSTMDCIHFHVTVLPFPLSEQLVFMSYLGFVSLDTSRKQREVLCHKEKNLESMFYMPNRIEGGMKSNRCK